MTPMLEGQVRERRVLANQQEGPVPKVEEPRVMSTFLDRAVGWWVILLPRDLREQIRAAEIRPLSPETKPPGHSPNDVG